LKKNGDTPVPEPEVKEEVKEEVKKRKVF